MQIGTGVQWAMGKAIALPDGWESAGTFNPAVIQRDGRIVMIYRAQDAVGISRLGYAESVDGIQFARRSDLESFLNRLLSRTSVSSLPTSSRSIPVLVLAVA